MRKRFIDIATYLCSLLALVIFAPVSWYRRASFAPQRAKRILLVLLHGVGVGNVVLLSPLVNALRKGIPGVHITSLVASEDKANLILSLLEIDDTIVFDSYQSMRFRERLRFVRSHVAPRGFDLAMTTFLQPVYWLSIWMFLSGARYRVGFVPGVLGGLDTWSLKSDPSLHEVERNLQILDCLHLDLEDGELSIPIEQEDRDFATRFFHAAGIEEEGLVLGIHPGASLSMGEKRWPLHRFMEIAHRFAEEFKGKVIFFGGPQDLGLMNEIRLCTDVLNITIAEEISLRRMATLIERCSLFLGNDSGLSHIAAALKKPIVVIYGPTIPNKNYPWKTSYTIMRKKISCSPCYKYEPVKCPRNYKYECLRSIQVEEVWDALCQLALGEVFALGKNDDSVYAVDTNARL